jgi:hypothetical protein
MNPTVERIVHYTLPDGRSAGEVLLPEPVA